MVGFGCGMSTIPAGDSAVGWICTSPAMTAVGVNSKVCVEVAGVQEAKAKKTKIERLILLTERLSCKLRFDCAPLRRAAYDHRRSAPENNLLME